MDKIPIEVFKSITIFLSFSEKLELMCVCKYFYSCILYTNLYSTVSSKGKTRCQQALDTLTSDDLFAKQVQRIQLTKPETNLETVLRIPSLLPHLKHFVWEDYANEDFEQEDILPEPMQALLTHWQKIEHIEETNRFLYTPLILKSGTFPQLRKVGINLHFTHSDFGNKIINHLDHAPQLTHFDITHISLDLGLMELLHKKAPHLEVLCLSEVTQMIRDFDVAYQSDMDRAQELRQIQIMPATQLHTIKFERISFHGITYGLERHWLKYISEKYTSVVNFTISGVGMSEIQPYYEEGLTWIATTCNNIEKYKVKIFPLTPMILTAMDQHGTRLKTLDIMSDGNAQEQLEDLANSQQKKHLETIHIKSFSGGNNIFDMLQRFSRLATVHISSSSAYIALDTALEKLPHLNSISITGCDVGLDTDNVAMASLQLTSFSLAKVMIHNHHHIMEWIARSSPQLDTLCIQGQMADTKSGPLNVHVPIHYLKFIKVYILGNSYYKVNNQRHTMWYKFRGKTLEETIKENEFKDTPSFYVSIVYQGLTQLNIGGTIIPNW